MKLLNVSKSYDNKVLFSDLSFSIERRINQLAGPSGCGKSALIHRCLGLEKPTGGEVSYGDFSFSGKKTKEIALFRNEKLGYCGEGSSLLYSFSLKENITRLLPNISEDKTKALCSKLSFGKIDKPLVRLSGGERHKAELIFAFLSEKETLFLDEPFSALDAASKTILVDLINEYAKNHLIVLVNHDIGVKGLILSLKIDIPSGKLETFSVEEPSNEISAKPTSFKKRNVILFFFRDFFKSFRLEIAVETLLIVASFLSLFFGLASYPSRNQLSAEKLAMDSDPFSSFVMGGSDSDQHAEFSAFVREKADTTCFSSWADYNIVLVSMKGLASDTTFYVDEDYGTAPSSVSLSGQSLFIDRTYKIPADKENYFLRSYKEKNNRSFVADGVDFVSPAFIDAFLDAGGFPALALEGKVGTMHSFLWYANHQLSFESSIGKSPLSIQIQTGSTDVLLLPDAQAGEKIPFHNGGNGWSGPSLTASGPAPDSHTMVVSPDYYRYLCYLKENNYSPFDMGLLPAFQENDAFTFLSRFSGSEVSGIIRPNYSYSESCGNLAFAIGVGLLVLYILLVVFSLKGKHRYFKNAWFFLSLQGFSAFENGGLLTAPFALQGLLAEGVGLLFYGTCFIPVTNNLLYQQNYEGSYAKSRGLSLYASTPAPLPFGIFNSWALLSLAIFLAMYGTMILVLSLRNGKASKTKQHPQKKHSPIEKEI